MNKNKTIHVIFSLGIILPVLLTTQFIYAEQQKILQYEGMCDASAALALDPSHFIVADDERNLFQIYHTANPLPVQVIQWDAQVEIGSEKHPEADIEGAAKIGDHIFWIGSHGRNKSGKFRPARHILFASKIKPDGSQFSFQPAGQPYRKLINDLIHSTKLKHLALKQYEPAMEVRNPKEVKKNEHLAPKKQGISIEGLSATANNSLLIGFRNPVPAGKAIIVEILNPLEIVSQQSKAEIGNVHLLDLNNGGIRSIEYNPDIDVYFIVSDNKLYRWSGNLGAQAKLLLESKKVENFTSEALFIEESGKLLVLSDDGSRMLPQAPNSKTKCPCKEIPDPSHRFFRGTKITIPIETTQKPQSNNGRIPR